jgi:hypothetical protein
MLETKRPIWYEKLERERLGNEGYAWFVSRFDEKCPNCPQCRGEREMLVPDPVTKKYNEDNGNKDSNPMMLVTCSTCVRYARRLSNFTRIYRDTVPPRYREITLKNLKPYGKSTLSTERQQEVINALKANPEGSYAFFGPPGTSKTTWTTALYADLLWKTCMREDYRRVFPVRRISTKLMLDQHTDWTMHKHDPDDEFKPMLMEPEVSSEKIKAASDSGGKFHLFLEEIDKIKETEVRRANLFEILNSLHDNYGQLVVNSNLTFNEFSNVFGADFSRRIRDICAIIDLFPPKERGKRTGPATEE